jgi:hypothetical protein
MKSEKKILFLKLSLKIIIHQKAETRRLVHLWGYAHFSQTSIFDSLV